MGTAKLILTIIATAAGIGLASIGLYEFAMGKAPAPAKAARVQPTQSINAPMHMGQPVINMPRPP